MAASAVSTGRRRSAAVSGNGNVERPPAAAPPVQRGPETGAHDVGLDGLLIRNADSRRRFVPGFEAVRFASALARHPRTAVRHTGALGARMARIVAGSQEPAPPRGDRRFADAAWSESWFFRRIMQAYLSVGETLRGLIDESGLEWDSEERLRFVVDNLIDALAPTNFPWLNPAAIKVTVDRGGRNLVTGARQAVRDATSPARIPANVDRSGFRVGENLATSPGGVVRREAMFELIQYTPQTGEVREIPLVVVPPMISKYYVVDLSPGRSLVEHLVGHGQQVLTLSWRQPGPENGDWDLDAYVGAIVEALETAREVTGAERVHVLGLCAGGVATACAAAHLAATGRQDTLAGLTLAVTVLDNHRAGTVSSFISPDTAAAAVERVRRKGYLDKAELARTFAWLRPNDMIWNYWVNNYLLGNKPPAFDLLYWNSDSMHMAAGLHRDFVRVGVDNPLAQPGQLSVLGTAVDLSAVSSDAYVIAGETDHITPWQNCYRTTGLLGGRVRFVLSTSGHIAAVINPPGNPRASYRVADQNPAGALTWLEGAVKLQGTWWDDWAAWLEERSGATAPAPRRLGSRRHPVIEAAPGSYVLND